MMNMMTSMTIRISWSGWSTEIWFAHFEDNWTVDLVDLDPQDVGGQEDDGGGGGDHHGAVPGSQGGGGGEGP